MASGSRVAVSPAISTAGRPDRPAHSPMPVGRTASRRQHRPRPTPGDVAAAARARRRRSDRRASRRRPHRCARSAHPFAQPQPRLRRQPHVGDRVMVRPAAMIVGCGSKSSSPATSKRQCANDNGVAAAGNAMVAATERTTSRAPAPTTMSISSSSPPSGVRYRYRSDARYPAPCGGPPARRTRRSRAACPGPRRCEPQCAIADSEPMTRNCSRHPGQHRGGGRILGQRDHRGGTAVGAPSSRPVPSHRDPRRRTGRGRSC